MRLINSCQWNHNPANFLARGVIFGTLKDFSIFSRDQQTVDWKKDINSGGRAIEGFCSSSIFISVTGIPLQMEFNMKNKTFFFAFDGDTSISSPT